MRQYQRFLPGRQRKQNADGDEVSRVHCSTKALVLRSVDYRETDRILTLLTPESGKLTVTARGSRKRGSTLTAGTQILTWSDMVLYEYRGHWFVKEAAIDRSFRGVEQDVERLSLGCYFAELAEVLSVEGIPAEGILPLILNSLHILDRQPGKSLELVKAAFELKLLCLSGYEPLLDGCNVCGEYLTQEYWFSCSEGVLRCTTCQREGDGQNLVLLRPAVLDAMRHIAYGNPKKLFSFQLDRDSLIQLSRVCEGYLTAQLERGFGTLDFFKQLHPVQQ